MRLDILKALLLSNLVCAQSAYSQSALTGIDTGRYEVKSSTKVVAEGPIQSRKSTQNTFKQKRRIASEEADVIPTPDLTSSSQNNVDKVVQKSEIPKEPRIGEQMESIFDSRLNKVLNFYQTAIDSDDIRKNRIETEFIPTITHLDSRSNYSYRRYSTQYLGFGLKATAWFTPRVGLFGYFNTSLAGEIESGNSSRDNVNAKFENVDMGLNFRSFDSLELKTASTELLLKISSKKTSIPSDESLRSSLNSSGIGIGFKNRLPSAVGRHVFFYGGTFYPRINHSEARTSNAGQSGNKEDSVRLDLEVGGELASDRKSTLLWNLNYGFERNTFSGAAGVTDPLTGSTPSNVGVSTSTLSFGLGYRWGR